MTISQALSFHALSSCTRQSHAIPANSHETSSQSNELRLGGAEDSPEVLRCLLATSNAFLLFKFSESK